MTLQNYQTGQQLYSLVFGLASHFNSSPTKKCGRQNFECVDLLFQQYSSPVTGSLEMKLLLTFFYTPLKEKVPYMVDPVHLFLSLSSESEFRRKPPPIALSAVACININL